MLVLSLWNKKPFHIDTYFLICSFIATAAVFAQEQVQEQEQVLTSIEVPVVVVVVVLLWILFSFS